MKLEEPLPPLVALDGLDLAARKVRADYLTGGIDPLAMEMLGLALEESQRTLTAYRGRGFQKGRKDG